MSDASLLAALGAFTMTMMAALASTVWYVITRSDRRQDKEREERDTALKDERQARERAQATDRDMFMRLYKDERDARDQARKDFDLAQQHARQDARNEVNVIASKQAAFELYCAREYVSYPRLTEALKPVLESQQRIFEKLDTKLDRPA